MKIKVIVEGLKYSQSQSNAYALLLSEENGSRKLPIVIGHPEAQAIAIALEIALAIKIAIKIAIEIGIAISLATTIAAAIGSADPMEFRWIHLNSNWRFAGSFRRSI